MFKFKTVLANNGATLDKDGNILAYKQGYQVSHEDLFVIPVYKLRKSLLIATLKELPMGDCLGIWIDNGKAYIDRSERITNKRLAIKVGKQRKQLAIYNWKTGDCIPCL